MDYQGKNAGIKEALNGLFTAIVARDERVAAEAVAAQPEPCPCCDHRGKPRVRYSDLLAARRIAGEKSRQTGRNYENFTSGRYDHAFGVQTALAAIEYGRRNP